jgi:signal transduction histidine kinase
MDRSRTTPGAGLGLSLVASIAALHGATLELGDNAPGLRVELAFPATPPGPWSPTPPPA